MLTKIIITNIEIAEVRHIFQAVAAFCFCFVESRGIGTLISQLKEAQGLEGVKGPMDWIVPRMLRYMDWIVSRMLRYMGLIVPRMLITWIG
jgi:hypothetical protein